jgi:transcriptional regulator with XRE-family HTH domain
MQMILVELFLGGNELIGERVKLARIAIEMSQEEVAKRLGLSKKVISQLENNKVITENIKGDLFAALSHLYQVSYSFLSNGEEKESDTITTQDILCFITDHHLLSWNAKGLLFHIYWREDSEPSFNTIRQFSGDNYEQTKSALNELIHYEMIFKYQIQGDIEVYGFNHLTVCHSIRVKRVMSR